MGRARSYSRCCMRNTANAFKLVATSGCSSPYMFTFISTIRSKHAMPSSGSPIRSNMRASFFRISDASRLPPLCTHSCVSSVVWYISLASSNFPIFTRMSARFVKPLSTSGCSLPYTLVAISTNSSPVSSACCKLSLTFSETESVYREVRLTMLSSSYAKRDFECALQTRQSIALSSLLYCRHRDKVQHKGTCRVGTVLLVVLIR
mmetsp:Transcript_26447/g.57466  ORF Transcript_26447/g.57466 Transcript_26447/m.57466 type:complete len:205 (+) Transcript_26447:588-1202(+)